MKNKLVGIIVVVMFITISLPIESTQNNDINIESTIKIWLFHGFILGKSLSYHEDDFGITFTPLFIIAIGLFNEAGHENHWLPDIRILQSKYLIILDGKNSKYIINGFFVCAFTNESTIFRYIPKK